MVKRLLAIWLAVVLAFGVSILPAGANSQQGKLTASDGAAWDGFGGSVSISGDTALVG